METAPKHDRDSVIVPLPPVVELCVEAIAKRHSRARRIYAQVDKTLTRIRSQKCRLLKFSSAIISKYFKVIQSW